MTHEREFALTLLYVLVSASVYSNSHWLTVHSYMRVSFTFPPLSCAKGPRGVQFSKQIPQALNLLMKTKVAPAGWKFDPKEWWLEEHGLVMVRKIRMLCLFVSTIRCGRRDYI